MRRIELFGNKSLIISDELDKYALGKGITLDKDHCLYFTRMGIILGKEIRHNMSGFISGQSNEELSEIMEKEIRLELDDFCHCTYKGQKLQIPRRIIKAYQTFIRPVESEDFRNIIDCLMDSGIEHPADALMYGIETELLSELVDNNIKDTLELESLMYEGRKIINFHSFSSKIYN